MSTFTATLQMPSRELAEIFTVAWSRKTLTGHAISPVRDDKSCEVTLWDVTEENKQWIDKIVTEMNGALSGGGID